MADDGKQQENPKQDASNLVWIDCETTGLDFDIHHIIEIAVLVTDKDLNVIAEGLDLVIHLDDEQLSKSNAWCKKHHEESGLTQRVKESKLEMDEAEAQVLQFIQQYVPPKASPLCGNSVQIDSRFISNDMPKLYDYLHYRLIDVTTLKELCNRWYPETSQKRPRKKYGHRAMSDIKESIEELKYYRRTMFVDGKGKN